MAETKNSHAAEDGRVPSPLVPGPVLVLELNRPDHPGDEYGHRLYDVRLGWKPPENSQPTVRPYPF